jgi:hypothetical protein
MNVRQQLKWLNALTVEGTKEQLKEIAKLPFVSQIDLVERYIKKPDNVENVINDNPQPEVLSSSNSDEILADSMNYGASLTQVSQMNVNLVHNQGIYGQGVLIASLDDGFRNQTHPAFTSAANPIVILNQYDFQLHIPGANHTGDTHGTTTISCIGAYAPGQLIGTAFKSKFIVARTEVDSFEHYVEMDNWSAAAQWADSLGADVITSSLGYLAFDAGYGPSYTWSDMNGKTLSVTRAAAIASNKGILVFNSAGNDGSGVGHNTLGGPADADSIITMGAVNSNGTVSSFSSVGPTTDVPARIKPDVMAMGNGVQTANGTGTGYSGSGSSGTSYSCPLAAGVGALILSVNKTLTPLQVRGILRKFASNSGSPNNTMGWGIINAYQSVDSARKLDNAPPTIVHTQPFNNTNNTGVITMKARVFDNGIIRTWTNQAPLLYFRKSTDNGGTWTSYTAANYNQLTLDTFYFPITGSASGTTVQYYFAAQDIALPTPLMATLPAGGTGVNPPGTTAPPTRFQFTVGPVGITPVSSNIPASFKLYNNYPNPFNPVTKIKFDIAKSTSAKLIVYDITGRVVETVINEDLVAGSYEISFDAARYASGVYFYKLETSAYTEVKKMLLIK